MLGVCIMPEPQPQSILLAKELAELSRVEAASQEALAKRIVDLEEVLAASRKELADVRVRNEKLEKQLKAATVAKETAEEALETAKL